MDKDFSTAWDVFSTFDGSRKRSDEHIFQKMDKHRLNFSLSSKSYVSSVQFLNVFNVSTGFDGCLLLTKPEIPLLVPILPCLAFFFNLQDPELKLKINPSNPEQPGGLNEQRQFKLTTFRGVLEDQVVICEKRRLAFENLWD